MAKKHKILWEDKFINKSELGEGGNAKVFKVIEKISGNEYALKCLCNKSAEKKSRFIDEIQIMSENAKIIEGIIPIYDCSEEQLWYTMPVAKSAIEYIKEKKLNYKEIITGAIQLSETLSPLHKKGIAHRDIKPSNIYYYEGRFYFGDFGLVEFPDNPNDFTRSDRGLGAIFTIAPEMKRDPKNSDGRKADVFSLAKTIWMFLTEDEKGFDGKYDFLDTSIGLRFDSKFKQVHLVELEELLTSATDNNPESRPTIDEFKEELEKWLEVVDDFEKSQLSGWKFINKYLFGDNAPQSSVWRKRDGIINVLNIIGTMPLYNHMLFSDCGGLDFRKVELANEEGCIYIYDTMGGCYIVKPKCLYYEAFEDNFKWNYFLLELNDLNPIFEKNDVCSYEYLVEDFPAHYVSAQYADYGVYDYDSGKEFPQGYKCVRRYLKGKFLIVLKNGPYNKISATYDGRHGLCSNDKFREYLEEMITKLNKLVFLGYEERQILNTETFSKNPFAHKDVEKKYLVDDKEIISEEKGKKIIVNNYKQWCFKKLYNRVSLKKNIRFYITFTNDSTSICLDEDEYLCNDGYIKNLKQNQINQIYYIYDRNEAITLLEKCNNLIEEKCKSKNAIVPKYEHFFDIEIERCGKPEHIFTKNEIKELMINADDRFSNQLVIDENGYARILQDINQGYLYPVSHETWGAGNKYVGKYSSLLTLEDDYISSLQGWLMYLKYNKNEYMDYVHDNIDEKKLLVEIKKYY